MLSVPIPARSWNSVRTNPGHSAISRTPLPARSRAAPWVNCTTHALLAPYVPRGTKAATEATLTTPPRRRSRMPVTAAEVSRSTASQCTFSIASSSAMGTSRNSPLLPKPALLTSRSTGCLRSPSRSSTAAMPSSVARSATSTPTSTPCRSCSSAAWSRSFSSLRATSTRLCPSAASRRANAAPMPAVAPVTNAVVIRERYRPGGDPPVGRGPGHRTGCQLLYIFRHFARRTDRIRPIAGRLRAEKPSALRTRQAVRHP